MALFLGREMASGQSIGKICLGNMIIYDMISYLSFAEREFMVRFERRAAGTLVNVREADEDVLRVRAGQRFAQVALSDAKNEKWTLAVC